MSDNQPKPREFDAVLGGKAPPPVDSLVLGGLEGVKRKLTTGVAEYRITALSEALKYGDAGLELVIQSLQNQSRDVRLTAYSLLRSRSELWVKQFERSEWVPLIPEPLPKNSSITSSRLIIFSCSVVRSF